MLSILLGTGGVRGNTGFQIGKSLRLKSMFSPSNLSEAREETKSLYKELVESFTTETTTKDQQIGQVVKISTGIFIQETFEINSNFQESVKADFQEEIEKDIRFTFVILLPLNKWEIHKPVQVLNGNKILSEYVNTLKETTVSLRLPRFNLKKTVDLVKPMEAMGIIDLFRPLEANVSGISPNETLYINAILQTSMLKVDESGIEAAAVTSPILVPVSFIRSEIDFHVTHPFICFIYDQQLSMPVMAAKVVEPML
ncbi:unnamed protein product [Heterobilharzia americana]|nr:unnamed protein product [Heterobilharzia americana]